LDVLDYSLPLRKQLAVECGFFRNLCSEFW